MEKFGWRGFCEVFVAGILLITVGYFAVRYQVIREEYTTYRDGLFARAYESLTLTLGAYLEDGDAAVLPSLSDRFAELPLSAEENSRIRQFLADIAAGSSDSEARARADRYAEALLRHFAASRTVSYQKSWRAAGMNLPAYPEPSVPALSRPKEEKEPEESNLNRAAAEAILGRRFVFYTRTEGEQRLLGYRSASGYVEYEGQCLVRAIAYQPVSVNTLEPEAIRASAERLLAAQGYPTVTHLSTERKGPAVTLTFRADAFRLCLTLAADTAALRSFWREPVD